MRNLHMPNKYESPCALCGELVAIGQGKLFAKKGKHVGFGKAKQPIWVAQHNKCKEQPHD